MQFVARIFNDICKKEIYALKSPKLQEFPGVLPLDPINKVAYLPSLTMLALSCSFMVSNLALPQIQLRRSNRRGSTKLKQSIQDTKYLQSSNHTTGLTLQWNLVIKRSDITKPSYNKVILLVPALYISLFFYPDIMRNLI